MSPGNLRFLTSQSTPISEGVARVALIVERYLLPWMNAWLAYGYFRALHGNYVQYRAMINHSIPQIAWPLFCAGVTRTLLMACLATFVALTLSVSRRPKHLPKYLTQIIVPLAMSYYYLGFYPIVKSMPSELSTSLLSQQWQVPAAVLAVFISLVGYGVQIWSLTHLGRSFSVLVAVRGVISSGPYAYTRHPIYFGYLIETAALILSSFCLGMLIVGIGYVLLMVMRARLEEELLVETCPTYREYMKITGFIFPWRNAHPVTLA